ncbi:MAG: GTP-binding protein [Vicinamibacteria bacterium]
MVFFNYTTMQVSAKIVYYGPGLCGKTTNLQQIHGRTDPGSRGEMVSLETEADRTLFFDLLPLEVGTIGGMRVRLQLYTVPGQDFYNTTRKLVLKGVDGIVFVADSQEPMLDANMESFANLRRNLEELNQPLEKIPFVFQYNKRDLRNILAVETLNRHLNRDGLEVFEGAALHGVGVFETLKAISRKTLAAVHRKISGEEPPPSVKRRAEAATRVAQAAPAPSHPPAAKTSDALFAELEDELDPEAVAITDAPAAPDEPIIEAELLPEETPSEPEPAIVPSFDAAAESAKTAEVKVEFAASGGGQRVETKSRLDIERELEQLRQMAFGAPRSRKPPPPSTLLLTGKGTALVPAETLARASGLAVDLKLVADGSTHVAPAVVRIELPPHERGGRARLSLEIEIGEEPE